MNIDNDGTPVIEGTKGNTTKRIALEGDAYVVFANVPADATGPNRCEAASHEHDRIIARVRLLVRHGSQRP